MIQQKKDLTIGLFGFGTAGSSLYHALTQISINGIHIKRICIRDAEKQRNAPSALFTTNRNELLRDPDIDVVVELTSDPRAAYEITCSALDVGKAVVTAGKKMLADNLPELIERARVAGLPLLYEAACCAGVPIIRNLEEYYANDSLKSVHGIVNGSTNYILTQMTVNGLSFSDALSRAKAAGFAEEDPTQDVGGEDAANKLTILLAHAWGITGQKPLYCGIDNIHPAEAKLAADRGECIKLVARAQKLPDGKIAAFVLPQFTNRQTKIAGILNEYNAVEIEGSLDKQFFSGRGAGGYPTASAILSDLQALRYNYQYDYRKLHHASSQLANDFYLKVCISYRSLLHVRHDDFVRIDEWISTENRCHISGIIHSSTLCGNWWKSGETSLIVYEDGLLSPEEVTNRWQEAIV